MPELQLQLRSMLWDCNWSMSHAGGAGTGMATGAVATGAAVPDAGLGTGTVEDASMCCKRRLGCSTFRGLNLREKDQRESTPQLQTDLSVYGQDQHRLTNITSPLQMFIGCRPHRKWNVTSIQVFAISFIGAQVLIFCLACQPVSLPNSCGTLQTTGSCKDMDFEKSSNFLQAQELA